MGTDYALLQTILPKLSRRVCFTASEPPLPVKTSPPGESIHTQYESKVDHNIRYPFKAALVLTAVCIFMLMVHSLKSSKNL